MSGKRKKILLVITRSHWGGAQRYLYDIAIGLPREKFDVRVVAGDNGALIQKLSESYVPVYTLKTTRNVGFFEETRTFFKLLNIFRNERPDIVHLNSSKIGGIGALAAWITGVPKIIFTAHGWAFSEDRPTHERYIIFLFSWISALFHDRIICVSDYDYQKAKKMPLVGKKCLTIHNGIHDIRLLGQNEARDFFKTRYGISPSENTIWIGTISELTKNKGLAYAIQSLSQLHDKNWIFLIIGAGELRNELTKLIARFKLKGNIFLIGQLENANQYLRAFDIFTLTSTKEGFPYALLEAGSAGLPIIASSVGGIPEIITDKKDGILVWPKNTQALTKELQRLIDNPQLRTQFSSRIKEKIGKEFHFDIMLEQTISAYK